MELSDHSIFWVFIDSGFVLDLLGSASISQCRERFVNVIVSRADRSNHDRLSVTSKRVLKDTGELGVTVGDVGALGVCQTADGVAESGKRQINLGGLLKSIASCSCLALPLRSRQVDNVQLSHSDMSLSFIIEF